MALIEPNSAMASAFNIVTPTIKETVTGCQETTADTRLQLAPMETIGDRIRTLRQAKGWRLADLVARMKARGAPITVSALSQLELGIIKSVKPVQLVILAEELGTTVHYLAFGPSDPNSRDISGRFRRPTAVGRSGNKP